MEDKKNGNGAPSAGHKIEEESEAAFQPTSEAALWVKIGDLCPECGEAAVVNEEGCRKCYACGYSEC
jgi:ribonucleoside-diphosphate reductase alpha chain